MGAGHGPWDRMVLISLSVKDGLAVALSAAEATEDRAMQATAMAANTTRDAVRLARLVPKIMASVPRRHYPGASPRKFSPCYQEIAARGPPNPAPGARTARGQIPPYRALQCRPGPLSRTPARGTIVSGECQALGGAGVPDLGRRRS